MKSRLLISTSFCMLTLFLTAGCAAKKGSPVSKAQSQSDRQEGEFNPDAYHHFTNAVIYEQEGLIAEAIKQYELALSYEPLSYDIRMALGQLYFRQTRYDDALNTLLPIPEKDSKAYELVGDCLRFLNRHLEAEIAYQNALKGNPSSPSLNYHLGVYSVASKNLDKAIQHFKASARSTSNPELYERIAEIYANKDAFDSTIAYYQLAIKAGHPSPEVRGKLAFYYNATGQADKSKATLYDAIGDFPEVARLYGQLIEIYDSENKIDSVTVFAEKLIALNSNDHVAYERIGQLLVKRDRNDLARRLLEKAFAINKSSRFALFYLGRLALEEEKLDTARQFFLRLVDVDNTVPDGWINLALIFDKQKQTDKAMGVLNEALESVEYERDDVRFYLAQLLDKSEQKDSAISVLKGVILEGGDTVQALFTIGAVHERKGEFDKAVETFELLLSVKPDHAQGLNYLGYMFADKGVRLDESLALIGKALKADSTNAAYLDSYAWVLYRLGRFNDALFQIKKAVVIMPKDATVTEHLGDIQAAVGNQDDARAAWEKALALDPQNEKLKEKLGR